MVQWLRLCLPTLGTPVWSLVWEDPTCCRTTKPVRHKLWSPNSRACAQQRERPLRREARSFTAAREQPHLSQLKKVWAKPWRPSAAKNKHKLKKKKQHCSKRSFHVSWEDAFSHRTSLAPILSRSLDYYLEVRLPGLQHWDGGNQSCIIWRVASC